MKILLRIVLGLAGAAIVAVIVALNWRPSADYGLAVVPTSDGKDLEVTFLGVSTLLFRDKESAVLVDGFFTRPGLYATGFGLLEPDAERIAYGLRLAGIEKLDAVVCAHSHYDHAMDAPEVARLTGAVVVGSESTANIARGAKLPEDRIRVVTGNETLRFGNLSVTLVPSKHFPHGFAMGDIDAPLAPPVKALDYLEGGSFSILVEKNRRAILVQSSAGYVEGALAGRRADVVYLGVGLLGSKDAPYRDAYWRETVSTVRAKRVVPIHWDDFTRGLDKPLVPLLRLFDDLDTSMDFLIDRAGMEGVELRWPVVGVPANPLSGL
jgi:L-ascorbate metabolism protein UlaG (beta-lactamase superfamily)